MAVIAHSSVDAFFQEILSEALSQAGVATSSSTEFYLVGLLGEFTKARISDEPLALRLAQVQAEAERVQALKEIGDTSLYVSGFFSESFNRQLVDVGYYIGMGGAAYRELSARMSNSSLSEVYGELAAKFPKFVDVLARIRSQMNVASQDVVTLYQEWMRTREDWIEDKLRERGVLVDPNGDESGSGSDDSNGGGYLQ